MKFMHPVRKEAKVPAEASQQPQESKSSKFLHQKCTFSKLLRTLLTVKKWNWSSGAAARFNVEDDEKFYIQDWAFHRV